MDHKLLLSDDEVADLKALYEKALKDKDDETIRILAGEAMQAVAYRAIVEECRDALSLGVEEATDVLNKMVPLAEGLKPLPLLDSRK